MNSMNFWISSWVPTTWVDYGGTIPNWFVEPERHQYSPKISESSALLCSILCSSSSSLFLPCFLNHLLTDYHFQLYGSISLLLSVVLRSISGCSESESVKGETYILLWKAAWVNATTLQRHSFLHTSYSPETQHIRSGVSPGQKSGIVHRAMKDVFFSFIRKTKVIINYLFSKMFQSISKFRTRALLTFLGSSIIVCSWNINLGIVLTSTMAYRDLCHTTTCICRLAMHLLNRCKDSSFCAFDDIRSLSGQDLTMTAEGRSRTAEQEKDRKKRCQKLVCGAELYPLAWSMADSEY